jgi:hypothetical protein
MTARSSPQSSAPALPGDCIPIPQVRIEVRDADGRTRRMVETHTVPGLDLDGHGSPVVLVPPETETNIDNLWWRLFIQRGPCGHELGIVVGMEDPVPEPGRSHGLRNFSMVEMVPPGHDLLQGIGSTVYRFDGRQYVGGQVDFR